jgi:hypothetical protein
MMNLTILVGTCDAYSQVWQNFEICLKKYWPYDTRVVMAGETKDGPFETVKCGKKPWADRINETLQCIDTDYLFFLLDDYFLCYQYPLEKVEKYLKDMTTHNMNRLQISRSAYQTYRSHNWDYLSLAPYSDYIFSLQPSLWRVNWVKDYLMPGFSPWDFELKNSRSIKGHPHGVFVDPSINFPVYFNAVRKGCVLSEGWDQFRDSEGLSDFLT